MSNKKIKVAVITSTRAEYGLLKLTLKKILLSKKLKLSLIVTGSHLSPTFGNTYKQIEEDGFTIDAKIDLLISSDTPSSIAKSMGVGIISVTQVFQEMKPDVLLILGDRFELLAIACAAIPFNIAIAHIAGGEITEGAFDERIRHALTKISHIHFCCAEAYKDNILEMCEEQWRVHNVGHPCLELIDSIELLSKSEVIKRFKLDSEKKIILATLHTTTINSFEEEKQQVKSFFNSIKKIKNSNIIITYPNSDTNSQLIINEIEEIKKNPNVFVSPNLGSLNYLSIMNICNLVVGNSSSGLVEGPYFKVPVINYGTRQKGRLTSTNVLNVNSNEIDLNHAIYTALYNEEFQKNLPNTISQYGHGLTSSKIVNILENLKLDKNLYTKKFIAKANSF